VPVLIGVVLLFSCVFGVFALHGGNIKVILAALPAELTIIMGAGISAMIMGYDLSTLKGVLFGMKKIFSSPKWRKENYVDTILLVLTLLRTLRLKGPKAIEADIEDPDSSPFFDKYPDLLRDRRLIMMITDTVRLMVASSNALNAYAVEDLLDKSLAEQYKHASEPTHALSSLAGALPALGIVACVLGIVKTMASIDQPPAILGALIGSALIGTLLGVFLAYGVVEPLAKRLELRLKEEEQIYHVVKELIVATLHGHPQPLVIESARVVINGHSQPTFDEVFNVI
jgi:chemotaxis protein MotA